MKRRAAPLENRLRDWVSQRVETRGQQKKFARDIDRPESWVTTYLDKTSHPDLDTSIKIAKAFNLSLEQVTGMRPLPEPDAATQQMYSLWSRIPEPLRPGALSVLEGLAMLPPVEAVKQTTPRGPGILSTTHRSRHKKPAVG